MPLSRLFALELRYTMERWRRSLSSTCIPESERNDTIFYGYLKKHIPCVKQTQLQ